MSTQIKLSRLAELDLEEIWLYTLETWSLQQANFYQDNLYLGFKEILDNPAVGKQIILNNRIFHYYKIAHHFIFYSVTQNELYVYRLLHEMMDFERHL